MRLSSLSVCPSHILKLRHPYLPPIAVHPYGQGLGSGAFSRPSVVRMNSSLSNFCIPSTFHDFWPLISERLSAPSYFDDNLTVKAELQARRICKNNSY